MASVVVAVVAAVVAAIQLSLFRVPAVGCSAPADTADVELLGRSWIAESPESGIAVRNKPYTLKCHSTLPNVSYRWVYNNRTLDLVTDPRRQILPNGSLFIKNVVNKRSGDVGQYRCIVQTPNGAASSKTVTLMIAAMHVFDRSPQNVTVGPETGPGSVVRLGCHISSVPEAAIAWEKDGVAVPDDNERYVTRVPGVLYIKNVDEKDAGTYRCVAKNVLLNKIVLSGAGRLNVAPDTALVQSDVQQLAFVSPPPGVVKRAAEGENVTFECAATGVPAPQLNWSFTTLAGKKHDSILGAADKTSVNVLTLTRVTANDSGTYTCHASQSVTGWPDFPRSQVFRLEVMTPPSITTRPGPITMPIANSVRFKCKTDGNPTPITFWYHNGQPLKLHGRIKIRDDQLLVSNTVSSDAGFYQCFASNQYGTAWAGASYVISSSPYEPAPPINISCRTLSSTQIQVSWRKSPTDTPDDPPIMIHDDSMQLVPSHSRGLMIPSAAADSGNKLRSAYTIHYVATDGGEEEQKVSVNHSIIVDKLKPYKNYTFYVRVYNGKSGSDQSEKVTCKTQDGVPQTVPELIVNPLNPVSLHVEWTAINGYLASGAIAQYHILWRRFRSVSNYVHVLPKNIRQYTITGLKPGGQYEVQVLGATQNGLPNIDFTWYFIELPSINPILPVPVLTYSFSQPSVIELSWSVPEDSGPFDSYRLMYRSTGQTNQSTMALHTLGLDINTYNIVDSNDMDVYEVLLNCISEMAGEGEPVTKTISVAMDVLSPPSQIEAVATSLHTLNVSWVPPDSIDLSSSLFIIDYNPVSNSSENSSRVYTDEGVTSYELPGLRPYCMYEIKLSAQDKNNRKSEFSQKIQLRTLQGVPGIVEQIEWHWINASIVRLNWAEPIKSNGVIVGYHISYTDELHVPPTSWAQLNVSRNKNSVELFNLSNNTQYFFMVCAFTDAGFGPQSGIFSIEPYSTPLTDTSVNPKLSAGSPAPLLEDEQLLGIVIGCVIGVCCILICTTSIVLKRQCMKAERVQDPQLNALNNDVTYCTQHVRPFTVDHVQHEEIVPLNDISFIARNVDGREQYSNNMSGMALLPLLDHSNVGDNDITNFHIIENPQCTVDVDAYDVDSLLSESAEGGAGTEESGGSDQLAKSQKIGDCSVIDDGFHEHVENNKMLVR